MKIIIPMAGRGSRLAAYYHETPKPLIPVQGKPIFVWAFDSIANLQYSELIFIILAEYEKKHKLSHSIHNLIGSEAKVIELESVTDGQLCTVLTTRKMIDTDEDILIISSDTYVKSNLDFDIKNRHPNCAGIISVAELPGEKWSFARTDGTKRVVEVAEKKRISDYASTGMYYFASGKEFVSFADDIIKKHEKTQGEYYVMPVYQKYIQQGLRVEISVVEEVWDMGTPKALDDFKAHIGS